MTKTMKKNKFMRLAGALCVLVLLTTCFISGTFAKYTAGAETDDSARVAKWGVNVSVAADTEAFATEYDNKAVVSAETDVKVVAPGTSGDLAKIVITGQPEVATSLVIDSTLTLTGWTLADSSFYCPIVVTVGSESISGLDYSSANDFIAAVEAKIDLTVASIAANTSLASTYDKQISWAWDFESVSYVKEATKPTTWVADTYYKADGTLLDEATFATETDVYTKVSNDANDTYLGDQANAGSASTIKFELTATVTQLDALN